MALMQKRYWKYRRINISNVLTIVVILHFLNKVSSRQLFDRIISADETKHQKLRKENYEYRKKDCWLLMRSCGNFVVIWFHCKFLHSWMVNFQEGIYWTDRAFNSAWANTLPFCLVTKLAKEKEKEKKIITTSNSLRILTQWKMFASNFHSSWI